jgi:hypothetical protein
MTSLTDFATDGWGRLSGSLAFIDESKKPNTRYDENYDFYALRDIGADEERTVDYATFSDYPDGEKPVRRRR